MTVTAIYRPPRITSRAVSVTRRVRGHGGSKQIVVHVRGEVDASNAKRFADAVCDAATGGRSTHRVTVDLSGLRFMALDGVAALHAINAHLIRAGVVWHAVPSGAVSRVLTLCDPESLLPVAAHSLRLVEPA